MSDNKSPAARPALLYQNSCHILPHAESSHGMFGMVTALIVK